MNKPKLQLASMYGQFGVMVLPNTVANLYNLATLECIINLTQDGLRLQLDNGRISEAHIIPDNVKEI